MTPRGLRALLLAASLVDAGCNMLPPPYPDPCAGSGRVHACNDAGGDAGADVGWDAASDVGRDALNADATWREDEPGWVHVAALRDECQIEVAMFPERVVPSETWTPDCGPGCLRREYVERTNLVYAGESDGVPVTVTLQATPESELEGWTYIVVRALDTSIAHFVLRDRRAARSAPGSASCVVSGYGVGAGSLALDVTYFDYDATGRFIESQWASILRGELNGGPASLRALVLREGGGGRPDQMVVSASHVAMHFGYGGPILIGNDGSYGGPGFGTSESRRVAHLAVTGESELFWEAWREPTVLVRSSHGEPGVVLHAVAGGDVRSFSTDGTDFVWLEARGWNGTTYGAVSLWRANYDGATLGTPQRVASVQGHADGAVSGGYYGHPEPNPADPTYPMFAFYRLSGGARAVFAHPVSPAPIVSASAGGFVVDGRYRIDPRALTFE